MKKILLLLAVTLGLTNCQLDETPYSAIFTETFYRTGQDAEAASTAAYGALANMYAGPAPLMSSDYSSDHIFPRPVVARDTYTLFSYDAAYSAATSFNRQNESPYQIWRAGYLGIEKTNWVLARVPGITMDTKRRDEILGEAYFLRAFYHWMLTKNFGDVPVKTEPTIELTKAFNAKKTKADVYKQIYADLEQAIPKLPSYSASLVKGRASKEAAQALYAKAALYNEDWTTALRQAQAVIASGKHALMAEVRDTYAIAREDAARLENMFAFESESFTPGFTSQIGALFGPIGGSAEYGATSFGSAFAYQSFFNSFDPRDKRRTLLDTTYLNRQNRVVPQREITPVTRQAVLVKKYQDPGSVGSAYASNIPILRYADVLLIAAEAEARANGATVLAYGYVNQIRKRAALPDLRAGLSKDDFIAAVLQERAWELFAEGDRWYDLSRTNTFLQVIPKAVNDLYPVRNPQAKHRYFPIPQDEINANPQIQQNPAWQ
jgi:starch-binding outer membrane protein, SusD/RagB family